MNKMLSDALVRLERAHHCVDHTGIIGDFVRLQEQVADTPRDADVQTWHYAIKANGKFPVAENLLLDRITKAIPAFFRYVISAHWDGEELESFTLPGWGNDWPNENNKQYAEFLERFGGVGYDIRIRTELIEDLKNE